MWIERPLSDLATVTSGGTPAREVAAYWGGDIPWVTPSDITACRANVLLETNECITAKGLAESAARLVPAQSILLTSRATVGEARMAGTQVCTNQGFKALTAKRGVDPWFLFYQVQRCRSEFERYAAGSTFLEISKRDTERVQLKHPTDIRSQQRIAAILISLDNAIEATEALIEKHQQIKAGLMHDLLTRGITRTGQLRPSPEIAPELFRREHDRWVPLDWRDVELQAVADVSRGKFTHRPRNDPRFLGGTHPFIQTGDIAAAAGDYLATYSQTLTDMGASVSSRFPAGTVAVTIAANIADTAILAVPMYFPDSVVGVVVRPVADVRFIELSIRFSKPRLEAMAPQSAQKNINLQDLRPLNLLLPSLEEQRAISQRYEAALYPIKQLQVQREKLRAQKQGLMQDLLTGKVRVPVPNAEAIA